MDSKLEIVLDRFKKETAKKCYKIELTNEKANLTDSKIGGIPFYPIGEEYPKDKNGFNMPLLIQINLDEIDLENYPKNGLLQVYVDKSLSYPAEYKIKYFENIDKKSQEIKDIDLSEFIVNKEIKINLIPNETYMPFGDYRFNDTFSRIFNDIFEANISNIFEIDSVVGQEGLYNEVLTSLNIEPGLVGGYADFTQTDPRMSGDSDLDECIIKIDSNLDPNRILIGDAGIIWVLISKENLKNRKFDEAELDWDCL